jgi:hypothetical protein
MLAFLLPFRNKKIISFPSFEIFRLITIYQCEFGLCFSAKPAELSWVDLTTLQSVRTPVDLKKLKIQAVFLNF